LYISIVGQFATGAAEPARNPCRAASRPRTCPITTLTPP